MASLFIADLHLSAERQATIDRFITFLENEATRAEKLYILGDLFEVWLGDDLILPEYRQVLESLKRLSEKGTQILVMHGNRDFLLGNEFERLSGCQLVEDPLRIDLDGRPTLLMHGDLLCTDDLPYQAMRQQLRNPAWIKDFLEKTPEQRIDFARELRERSRRETGAKEETIMDVNPQTVERYLREHDASRLIHGHTHRPGHHRIGDSGERFVLPEWSEHAGGLWCDRDGCNLLELN